MLAELSLYLYHTIFTIKSANVHYTQWLSYVLNNNLFTNVSTQLSSTCSKGGPPYVDLCS